AIPTLSYSPTSQNQRVKGYEITNDEQPKIYSVENLPQGSDLDDIVWAAYRQIFNEQQIISFNRERNLESQLRSGQLTVREFMRGLVLSDTFRRLNYDTNSNYRLVELCVQRLLGRAVYGEDEKITWSIVIATKGLQGFVDELLNSDEYLENFGDDIVPYQRRRVLPQRNSGDMPFARMARYDANHLDRQKRLGILKVYKPVVDNSRRVYRRSIVFLGAGAIALLLVTLGLAIS
ncbi:MAG: phycobilisome rod-core linker polypeptide, partial [Cyanobacteria bacterium P01_D01_bin.73]